MMCYWNGSAFSVPKMIWNTPVCQGSQNCYLTGRSSPTGNVLCGLELWEFCGLFDLDRGQWFRKLVRDQKVLSCFLALAVGGLKI